MDALEKVAETTGNIPESLLSRPILKQDEVWLFSCFMELSRDRRYIEGGPLPITLTEVLQYCQFYSEPDPLYILRFIRALDDLYLKTKGEEMERKMKKSSGKTKG